MEYWQLKIEREKDTQCMNNLLIFGKDIEVNLTKVCKSCLNNKMKMCEIYVRNYAIELTIIIAKLFSLALL